MNLSKFSKLFGWFFNSPASSPLTKTIYVEATVEDADIYPEEHRVSVTIKVPSEIPAEALQPITEQAADWCKKMAEGLGNAMWAKPYGRD